MSVMRYLRPSVVLLVAIGAIGMACAPSRMTQPAPTRLVVTATEFKFQSSTPRVAIGQPVTITFENHGTIEHNWHLPATGTHLIAAPGQTVSATVVFPTAGDFAFVCSIPGHEAAGMGGKVQAGDPVPVRASTAALETPAATVPDAALPPLPPATPRVPQGQVAPPLERRVPALVKVDLVIKEVVGALADGVGFKYWTFGGTVPGPMLRVRQGDTVELTLTNPTGIPMSHSINVHAAVDREFYVMQSDVYVQGTANAPGLHDFAFDKLLHEHPDYGLQRQRWLAHRRPGDGGPRWRYGPLLLRRHVRRTH